MDGMDKNGLLNGRWTMDDGRWTEIMSRPYRADSNIADPTDLTDPTDPSEKPIDQITNSRAISSVEAATPINFPRLPCLPWTKIGLKRIAGIRNCYDFPGFSMFQVTFSMIPYDFS